MTCLSNPYDKEKMFKVLFAIETAIKSIDADKDHFFVGMLDLTAKRFTGHLSLAEMVFTLEYDKWMVEQR